MSETKQDSNSAIGMSGDSLPEDPVDNTPNADSVNQFFDGLDQGVNGAILDDNHEVTQSQTSGSTPVTRTKNDTGSNTVDWESDNNPYKKRYRDSSREAVNKAETLSELKPFIPVLEAMKKDSGLVDHVRGYLQNGGKPSTTITEQLGIGEDFVFDQAEAMQNPDSDSAKVMSAYVDNMVQGRVGQMLQQEKQNAVQVQKQIARKKEEQAFRERTGMTDEEFAGFVEQAKTHKMTLEDVHYLINRDKANANVANSTKQDMLNQMKSVRNMPTSAAGANSQGDNNNPDSNLFDGLLGLDNSVDKLFE
jgi:hypothetical protein